MCKMFCSFKLTIFVVTVGFQNVQGMCPEINGQHCFPPIGDTCIISNVRNGTGLTWFDMEKRCAVDGGRLVFMRSKFDVNHLLKTTHISNNTQILAIGMMMSLEGDNKTYWINPRENDTFSCGLKDTKICVTSSATAEKCNLIGCCWVNGKCQYPEDQWLAVNNISAGVDTSAVATTTERVCVGLGLKSRKLVAYNCSLPAATGTGFICEYNCGAGWPVLPRQNLTLSLVTSKPDTGTGNNRNKASASVLIDKISLAIYFGLLPLVYGILTF